MHTAYQKYLLPLGLFLAALFILAASLSSIRFRPGKPLDLIDWFLAELAEQDPTELPEISGSTSQPDFLPALGDTMLTSMILLFWAMLIFAVLLTIISPKFRRELIRIFAMIFPLVILLPKIAEIMAQRSETEEAAPVEVAYDQTIYPQPPPFILDPPDWLFWLANSIIVLLLFGSVYFLWRRLRPKPDAQAVVVKEVRQALSDLEAGLELKNIVIVCYAKMCQGLLQSRQIQRHRNMTPREFEQHLANAGIRNEDIRALTHLFEDVRYGTKSIDKSTEHQAKQCLSAILQVYE